MLQHIAAESLKHSTLHVTGTIRNVLLGAGLNYSIERKEYLHIPLILIFPSIYAGYELYRNKNTVVDWIVASKKKMKGGWLE